MTDEELAGYIYEKFENPEVVHRYGKDGVVIGSTRVVPTLQGICFELRITASEFGERCARSAELARVVELCCQREYDLVFGGGLSGEFNGSFANSVMQNRHGWREKKDSEVKKVGVVDPRTLERLGELLKLVGGGDGAKVVSAQPE